MRRIRELLRLKYEPGRSHREIALSPGVANSTVGGYADRAGAVGLSWPLRGWTTRRGAGGGALPPASVLVGVLAVSSCTSSMGRAAAVRHVGRRVMAPLRNRMFFPGRSLPSLLR